MSELPFWAQQEYRAREAEEKYRVLYAAVRHYFDAEAMEDHSEYFRIEERLQDLVDWNPPEYEEEREAEYEQAMEDAQRAEIRDRLAAAPDDWPEGTGPFGF